MQPGNKEPYNKDEQAKCFFFIYCTKRKIKTHQQTKNKVNDNNIIINKFIKDEL